MSEAEPTDVSLDALEEALGYVFRDRVLLEQALQHSSFAHDNPGTESNERLEFLGDSVVGLIVAHTFYEAKPEWDEGELTRALHGLVEGRSLSRLARLLDLGPHLRFGRTERGSGAEKNSILADAMESVIGAMYLDGGFEAATTFVRRVFAEALTADAPSVARDPKTELQERTMESKGSFPTYRLIVDTLVEGDDERFSVEVVLMGEPLASGIGRTKRAAERKAAESALELWVDDDTSAESEID